MTDRPPPSLHRHVDRRITVHPDEVEQADLRTWRRLSFGRMLAEFLLVSALIILAGVSAFVLVLGSFS